MNGGEVFYRDGYEYEFLEAIDDSHVLVREVESGDVVVVLSPEVESAGRRVISESDRKQREVQRMIREANQRSLIAKRQEEQKNRDASIRERQEKAAQRRLTQRMEQRARATARQLELAKRREERQKKRQDEIEEAQRKTGALDQSPQLASQRRAVLNPVAKKVGHKKDNPTLESSQQLRGDRIELLRFLSAYASLEMESNVRVQLRLTTELLNQVEEKFAKLHATVEGDDWKLLRKKLEHLRNRLCTELVDESDIDQ